jgi:hypothetical protein
MTSELILKYEILVTAAFLIYKTYRKATNFSSGIDRKAWHGSRKLTRFLEAPDQTKWYGSVSESMDEDT